MTSDGLVGGAEPTLARRSQTASSGSAVVPTLEGRRPLVVGCRHSSVAPPGVPARRTAQGRPVTSRNVARCTRSPLRCAHYSHRRIRLSRRWCTHREPGLISHSAWQLRRRLSTVRCHLTSPSSERLVNGEVRQVAQPDRRFSEAHRLGFTRVVPTSVAQPIDSIEIIRVSGVSEALEAAGLL